MSKRKLYVDADCIITPRPSGIGSMTVQLIRALSEDPDFIEKFHIELITPFNKAHLINQWHFNEHISIRRIPLTGRMVAALVKLRLLPPVDVFLGKGIYLFPNFRNWPLMKSKSITYIHDVSFRVFPEFVETKNYDYLTKNVNIWIERADKIITVSKHAKKEINRFYSGSARKTDVVYNGINTSFVPISREKVVPFISEFGLRYNEYFMFLSNLEPRKNVTGLLDAYQLFIAQKSHEHVKLLLVGGMGWKNEQILTRINEINATETHVIVPDLYVPDELLPALLSGAAALVHPAHYEGFGISPLQAMAVGTQLVVSRNSSLPEVVGDGGIYVDDNDSRDIYRAMNIAYNRRQTVNSDGIKRAKSFQWKQSAQQLGKIITTLGGKG